MSMDDERVGEVEMYPLELGPDDLSQIFKEIEYANVPNAIKMIITHLQPPPSEEQAKGILLAAAFDHIIRRSKNALTDLDYVRIAHQFLNVDYDPWEGMCINIANRWIRRFLARRRFGRKRNVINRKKIRLNRE